MLTRPLGMPYWLGPVSGVIIAFASASIDLDLARCALSPLIAPLLFLVFAVPLAASLDRLGLFEALAGCVAGGRYFVAWLWVLAAGVVIVFNLDAAVVLLTPLYVRLAQRYGYPPEALAFQPALLACLASSLLPVSNLTNLVAADRLDLDVGDFFRNMALPTLTACTVGFIAYQRMFRLASPPHRTREVVDRRVLRRGMPIVVFVLLGFTVGDAAGVPAWSIAAIAAGWASLLCRRVQWRVVPLGAIAVAASLGILVAAALPFLQLDIVFEPAGRSGDLSALVYGIVGSNATNNLPAILAGVPSVVRDDQVWPLLIGTNLGPVLVFTGSLSTLLWKDTAKRVGVDVSAARYNAVGVRVGLPALLAAGIVVVAIS